MAVDQLSIYLATHCYGGQALIGRARDPLVDPASCRYLTDREASSYRWRAESGEIRT